MKTYDETNIESLLDSGLSLDAQANVINQILNNVLDEGAVRARIVRFKLQKYICFKRNSFRWKRGKGSSK